MLFSQDNNETSRNSRFNNFSPLHLNLHYTVFVPNKYFDIPASQNCLMTDSLNWNIFWNELGFPISKLSDNCGKECHFQSRLFLQFESSQLWMFWTLTNETIQKWNSKFDWPTSLNYTVISKANLGSNQFSIELFFPISFLNFYLAFLL